MEINIYVHPIASSQMSAGAVGTYVQEPMALYEAVVAAIETYVFPEDGQAVISLPKEVCGIVLPGVARRTDRPEDYKNVFYRGKMEQFLDRRKVELPSLDEVAVVVYTAEAFLADPQTSDEEKAGFIKAGFTHCWVTTRAGPKGPVTPWRFVVNLAGGNAAYETMTKDALVEMAKEIEAYESEWCVVA